MPHTPAADAVDEDPAVGAPYDTGPVAPTPQGPDQTDRVIIAAAEEIGTGCPCGLIVVDDATGQPLPGMTVELVTNSGTVGGTTTTDQNGQFEVMGSAGLAKYSLRVSGSGYWSYVKI